MDLSPAVSHEDLLELFFTQSLDGFFFMMLDRGVRWDESTDKEACLELVFEHQRLTRLNDALLAQYGASRDQLLGRTPRELFAHDVEYGKGLWRRLFDDGRLHVDSDERKLDGTPMWVEGDYICLYDRQQRIIGHFGIQREVTERKAQEDLLRQRVAERTAELRGSEERLRAIVGAMSDLVLLVDEDGRYRDILANNQDLLVLDRERLQGRLMGDVIPGTETRNFLAAVRRTIMTGRAEVLEYELEVRAGRRWFEGRTAATDLVVDGRRCVVFVVRDITDRRRAEQLREQNLYLQEAMSERENRGELVGESPVMQQVFRSLEMVARTDSTVLLLGETGTGKELAARAIHDLSMRRDNVLVTVNCGALPEGLVESELFGYEKGAFTGAAARRKGKFEVACGGTLLLDEVGELPLEAQVKLLRVLQEQEIERVGGTEPVRVDVRVIAATNGDLRELVSEGAFRSDLYYRLNVFPIEIPPLRERPEDIETLARHFVAKFARRMGKPVTSLSRAAMERLRGYSWPGNARELANVLERGVILCQGATIELEHVADLDGPAVPGRPAEPPLAAGSRQGTPTLQELERAHILSVLERTGGVLSGPRGAAGILGLKRTTLWSRMRKLGINGQRTH